MSVIALRGSQKRTKEREAEQADLLAHPYYPLKIEVNPRFGKGAEAYLIFSQDVPDSGVVENVIGQLCASDKFRGKSVDVITYPVGHLGQEMGVVIVLKPAIRRIDVRQG